MRREKEINSFLRKKLVGHNGNGEMDRERGHCGEDQIGEEKARWEIVSKKTFS